MRGRSMLAGSSAKPIHVLLTAVILLVASITSLTTLAQSSDATVSALRPFEAVYKTTALGIHLAFLRLPIRLPNLV